MSDLQTAIVEIRENATGIVRLHWDEYWAGPFMWGDGNYGCDCNRALFFLASAGPGADGDFACGEERFSVRISSADDGRTLYQDGENWSNV